MKAEEMIPILNQWRDDMIEVDMHMQALARVTGMSPDSLLWTAVSGTQERLTRATEHIVGDTCQWMSWFWLENDMGMKGMDAGYQDDMRPIKTVEDLAWLITGDRPADGAGA